MGAQGQARMSSAHSSLKREPVHFQATASTHLNETALSTPKSQVLAILRVNIKDFQPVNNTVKAERFVPCSYCLLQFAPNQRPAC